MISVIFDMDGVLVDSESVICEAAILGLKEYGVHAVPEDFKPFVGTGEDRFIGGVAEKHGLSYKSSMKQRVYEIYLSIVKDKIKVFDGVHELLQLLYDKKVKTAIGSSADRIKVVANLDAAGISLDLFQAIISGEDVIIKKPDPEIFLKAATQLGDTPENCIVIEDAVNGVRAAKAAGMKCIAVVTSFEKEQLAACKPDHICTDIKDVRQKLMPYLNGQLGSA